MAFLEAVLTTWNWEVAAYSRMALGFKEVLGSTRTAHSIKKKWNRMQANS